MPTIGVFFILNSPNIYPPEDRSKSFVWIDARNVQTIYAHRSVRVFVCILLSGTPAAVNQLVVTQLYNAEGTAHTLVRFLLLQCKSPPPSNILVESDSGM